MDRTVSDLVATHSACALVLERYQIDYCRDGQRSLISACNQQHLDPGKILFSCGVAIRLREERAPCSPEALSTKQLLLTVIARHHRYLHDTLPVLPPFAERLAIRHGERRPRLRAIAVAVKALAARLLEHISEEERTILPACGWGNAAGVRDRLAASEDAHDEILASLATLRTLCNQFAPPEAACAEQRALYAELEYLECDTKRLVHIEDDILFRRFRAPS